MPAGPITVISRNWAKPGREEDVRRELSRLVPPTRRIPGCINYDLHQSPDDPSLFLSHQNWADENAFKAHITSPEVLDWRARSDEYLVRLPEVTFWRRVEP